MIEGGPLSELCEWAAVRSGNTSSAALEPCWLLCEAGWRLPVGVDELEPSPSLESLEEGRRELDMNELARGEDEGDALPSRDDDCGLVEKEDRRGEGGRGVLRPSVGEVTSPS